MFISDVFGSVNDHLVNDKILTTGTFGPSKGLRILLNVNQKEACGWFWYRGGDGFTTYIHDQTDGGMFQASSEIFLQPGRSYSILLKPINYRRKTEHLGLCKSEMSIPNIGVNGNYLNSVCFLLCYIRYIYTKCYCLPVIVGNNAPMINKIFGLNSTICLIQNIQCFSSYTEKFLQIYQTGICTHCKPQCSETLYDTLISETIFPSDNLLQEFHRELREDINGTDLRKNYLLINLYFESMNFETVTESQEFTFLDLLMYIGGNLCLFLGVSFIIAFEPAYQLLFIFFKLVEKIRKKYIRFLKKRKRRKLSIKFRKTRIRRKSRTKVKRISLVQEKLIIQTKAR